MEVAGRRITVMGLGRHGGGVAVARWLAGRGARVTVTDLAERDALAESIAALADVPIARWRLGGHDEADFSTADAVVANPAVRADHPLLAVARAHGAVLTSEIELFLAECPGDVIGVTGSNGKSSTATLLASMFQVAGRRVWLGGNIGQSLLSTLEAMRPADVVVLELSSFQLAQLSPTARFPRAALVTGCTPNHLDWHGTLPAYAAAKRRLVEHLPAGGLAVLNPRDPEVASWPVPAHARRLEPWPPERVAGLSVPGEHQRANAALAAAMAEAFNVPAAAIETALAAFRPLAHRQQSLGKVGGRTFIDDSKSTTPEATLAALAACPGPVWLLAGGQDKRLPLESFGRELARRGVGVACYGALGPALGVALEQAAEELGSRPSYVVVERLEQALTWCWIRSRPGDTILLSPAAASLDQFRDFYHRGRVFRDLVARLGEPPTA
ncbi:MAG TPA: UDP-N-acetylmuramoyl-L-alanine--D-glutamate ligase [Pirellulales bacterium]|nr:UDP-N-acetylmuramoyl-L-alanine--D-glutamate ligase [Pirellulales bacterium]